MNRFALLFFFSLLFSGCATDQFLQPLQSVALDRVYHNVDYLHDIKPILDKRCVVCHSCYNSPCQLKMSSYEGLDRGGSKKAVYDSKRLWTMEPSRLFIDAQSTREWREKGFHSVTENVEEGRQNTSFIYRLLDQKNSVPTPKGSYEPEVDELTCAETTAELDEYLRTHPNRGMPYGFPPLKDKEFQLISDWLAEGGKGPDDDEQRNRSAIAASDLADVKKWEEFFNLPDAKHAMTARYLYEHLFLAHITFSAEDNVFYELIRSRTPSPQPIEVIPSVRPYDDPGGEFYYRFRRIYTTIVHKTHMVVELNDQQMARFQELFIEPPWLQEPEVQPYGSTSGANPFVVFEQIPPRSRYNFLLDNSHYIIMTFIRGPVCKGQVALNVVQDHFWLLFTDPDHDLTVQHPGFLKEHADLLRIPTEQGSFFSLFKLWMIPRYEKIAARYAGARQDYYALSHRYRGLDQNAIWAGDHSGHNPLLTVFRHFNSGSVHPGALGGLPRTIWVMDYPLLERIYYALVAGFDVYGSVGHQLAVRLYMNNLRQEGETYFLNFLPENVRKETISSWNGGIDPESIHYAEAGMPAGFRYQTDDPKREFLEYLVAHHFRADSGISFDENYLGGKDYPQMPDTFNGEGDYIRGFHTVSAPGCSFFQHVADHNANLAYVRIRVSDEQDEVVSMVIHRWHDDVRTMSKEDDKLNPAKDEADFIRGYVGCYPNYFFVVDLVDLPDFLKILQEYDGSREAVARLSRYGVNRADEDFWNHYDWFQQDFLRRNPSSAGLFDLNRYYHLAFNEESSSALSQLADKK